MKPFIFPIALSLALLPGLATAQEAPKTDPAPPPAPAEAAKPPVAPKADEDPTLEKLKNLPPEQAEKVKKAISDASAFVGGIRLQEALQRLSEAEVILPDLFMIHNLRGAVFTKMRLFDRARESFKKAQQLHPTSFHPKFNLAEIEFVEAAEKARAGNQAATAQFASAQKMFEALIAGPVDESTRKLIQFKILISQLKQGQIEEAEKAARAFSYIDDEPIYYMAHAAVEFQRGNKSEAQTWIDSANSIWRTSPQSVTIYMDSFIEIGWVETLAL